MKLNLLFLLVLNVFFKIDVENITFENFLKYYKKTDFIHYRKKNFQLYC